MKGVKNPIVPGWYADPEARIYNEKYWIYVTRSHKDYTLQMNLDAFSSSDMVTWEKHQSIVDIQSFPWIWRAVWAPTIIEKGGRYYLIFASNDIQLDNEIGGLEIAVADSPNGPFKGYIGKPLIDRFINKAQPIDAHLFKDDDGIIYLYYGGWGHCNVAIMNDDMNGFITLENGEQFKEITPYGYTEGPCMLKNKDTYFFMWSNGCWEDGSYCVRYGTSHSPFGPFVHKGECLKSQPPVAIGPGHHGYLYEPKTDEWFCVYHRRIIEEVDPGCRVLCIDRMNVQDDIIEKIMMTKEW